MSNANEIAQQSLGVEWCVLVEGVQRVVASVDVSFTESTELTISRLL